MKNRILIGDSFNPWHNLAVEEMLFDLLGEDECIFYLWQNKNTVVIGRHQNAWKECRTKLLEDEGGKLARRSSGGGAVFHDLGNLNFTFVVPRGKYDVQRQLNVIRRAVASFGLETEFTGRNDLVVSESGAKFSGNAFRFSEKTGLHHGTIMMDVDVDKLGRYLAPGKDKLKAKGIESVRSRVCNLRALNPEITIENMTEALKNAFQQEYGPAEEMSMNDIAGNELAVLEEKYSSWDFRMGRALPFDVTLENRFSWGGVTMELSLKDGVIKEAQVFSDAMDEALIEKIAPALMNVRYENAALAGAVKSLGNTQTDELADWLETHEL